MMADLSKDQIEFRLHGLTTEDHGRVPAKVFANKLSQLVTALEAADRIANGQVIHTYTIAKLHTSQPTAVLRQQLIEESSVEGHSAFPSFMTNVDAVKTHDQAVVKLEDFVSSVRRMTSGAGKKFSFAEIRTATSNVRVDEFLRERAASVMSAKTDKWFSGAVMASFDGQLDYVDARGALPQIKLTLGSGGAEIDCICKREDIDAIGEVLSRRVRVFGRAIYSSHSPLPLRVEVTDIELVDEGRDFTRWRGAFKPFEIDGWEEGL
jgi:hypothetical protein